MKKVVLVVAILSIVGFFSCSKYYVHDHEIRIENNYPYDISSIYIGTVSFGSVYTGEITSYKDIEEGTHNITGSVDGGGSLSGSVTVEGVGIYSWTLEIDSYGDFYIYED